MDKVTASLHQVRQGMARAVTVGILSHHGASLAPTGFPRPVGS
ncbi:hypothetical protein FLM9_55 [Candidatus Synechococcus spongiarum]|uniref:Uncharacterized protein n=1 Tax=Candidatus Synechococcus spongiarum TaxID=431041 RepID=A0A171DED9_9SYNE|nr:hypothetical protein FLM9_55 [Candidatus Synechococcus spongiarum]